MKYQFSFIVRVLSIAITVLTVGTAIGLMTVHYQRNASFIRCIEWRDFNICDVLLAYIRKTNMTIQAHGIDYKIYIWSLPPNACDQRDYLFAKGKEGVHEISEFAGFHDLKRGESMQRIVEEYFEWQQILYGKTFILNGVPDLCGNILFETKIGEKKGEIYYTCREPVWVKCLKYEIREDGKIIANDFIYCYLRGEKERWLWENVIDYINSEENAKSS